MAASVTAEACACNINYEQSHIHIEATQDCSVHSQVKLGDLELPSLTLINCSQGIKDKQ